MSKSNDSVQDYKPMVTRWSLTTDTTEGRTIRIPIAPGYAGQWYDFNFTVDWGDGTVEQYAADLTLSTGLQQAIPSHEYATTGIQTVTITGKLTYWYAPATDILDRNKLIDILHCGYTGLTNMEWAFSQCGNLRYVENNSEWTKNVTNMEHVFYQCGNFNSPCDKWDTSKVVTMANMFREATSFNQPIEKWNVSRVSDFNAMFNCVNNDGTFNQPLGNWDMSSAINIQNMFHGSATFNQNLNDWDVRNVLYVKWIFSGSGFNNGDTPNASNIPLIWNLYSASSLEGIFYQASAFNQSISSWVTDGSDGSVPITNMQDMFPASGFNQPLPNFVHSGVTNTSYMFGRRDYSLVFIGGSPFNQDVSSWDVSGVTNMQEMFYGTPFNSNINWTMSSSPININLREMFRSASQFNQDISSWDVSLCTNMTGMFQDAPLFNQDISGWDTSSVTTFGDMFFGASVFDQNIGLWDYTAINTPTTSLANFLSDTVNNTTYYDALLVNLAGTGKTGYNLGATGRDYTATGETARNTLVSNSWNVIDGNLVP